MKIAKVSIVTIDVICPYCFADIEEPDSGSLNWEITSIRDLGILECFECKKKFKLPSRIKGERI